MYFLEILRDMDEFADAGEEHNVDAAAEGRHLVARRPALHVRNIHVSTLKCNQPKI